MNKGKPAPNWAETAVVNDYSDFSRRAFWKAYNWQAAVGLFRSGVMQNGGNVLDLGVGPGWITFIMSDMAPQAHYTGIDLSHEMVRAAQEFAAANGKPDLEFVQGDVTQLPFSDNTFDLITSFAVMRLVPDPELMIREAYRVLRPGGLMYISDVGQMPVENRQPFLDGIENPVAYDIMQKALASAMSVEEIETILQNIDLPERELKTGWMGGISSGSREILDWVKDGFPLRDLRSVGDGPEWSQEISKHWLHLYIRKPL